MRMRVLLLLVCLGCGSTDPESSIIDDTPGEVQWSAMAASTYGNCGLTSDGRAHCWGFRPGVTTAVIDPVPRPVTTTLRFTTLSAGGAMACGITAASRIHCWGDLLTASLGDGTTERSETPVEVSMARPAQQVTVGFEHACALDDEGTAYCWGRGFSDLGDGIDSLFVRNYKTPHAVATTLKFRSISAGTTQTCAVDTNDDAYCWGGSYGTLGIGARDTACTFGPSCYSANEPELVEGGMKWKAIAAGNAATCGITKSDDAYCWGEVRQSFQPDAPLGMLGAGAFVGSKSPVAVVGGLRFKSVSVGTRHVCGVTLDNEGYCWGSNGSGELGAGDAAFDGRSHTPVRIAGGLRFSAVSAGEDSCAVSVNGNAYCWGRRASGAIGDGITGLGIRRSPARVSAPTP